MCAQASFLLPTIWKSQLLLQSYKCLVYILWGLCRVEYILQDVCWPVSILSPKLYAQEGRELGELMLFRLVMGMEMQTPTCVADTKHPVALLLI